MKNLNEMTIVELTALYNSSVESDKQIKKFRTKRDALVRTLARIEAIQTAFDKDVDPMFDPEIVEKPTYTESMQETIEGVNIDGTTSTQPVVIDQQTEGHIRVIRGERRKPVKGVVKACRQMLTLNLADAAIVLHLSDIYAQGGYDEKAAKSSAQTILADTKKRLQPMTISQLP